MKQWEKVLMAPGGSIRQALSVLNDVRSQFVMVVDEARCLLGTVTDGDIRRGLLRGLGLDSPVESIMHRDPLVVPPEMPRESIGKLLAANRVHHLPVVDARRTVVGLHTLDDLLEREARSNLMVVMAGGKGTRLRPYTESCPKPLLPVNGKPILEHIVQRAQEDGFSRFLFSVHYLGEMIQDYFGDGSRWGVDIQYVYENEPIGTAGALSLMPPPDMPIVVTNGDVMTDIRYSELLDFHLRHDAAATMAVRMHEWQNPFGVVSLNGVDLVGFEEKPVSRSYVNAGIYALEPEALGLLVKNEYCDMPMLFDRLRQEGHRTIAFPMHEPWLDVGRPADLAAANATPEGGER